MNHMQLNRELNVQPAAAFLKRRPGFDAALRQARLNVKALIPNLAALRPDYFQLMKRDGRVYAIKRIG